MIIEEVIEVEAEGGTKKKHPQRSHLFRGLWLKLRSRRRERLNSQMNLKWHSVDNGETLRSQRLSLRKSQRQSGQYLWNKWLHKRKKLLLNMTNQKNKNIKKKILLKNIKSNKLQKLTIRKNELSHIKRREKWEKSKSRVSLQLKKLRLKKR
jgi:hypothetical protein